ncbi:MULTISPECIES: hypothetical protein [unclassified Neochlamydia]|uniref:hypothetical protein n=1 Tax=unclassified Neochlamydia TaxID=2643326 RepID=UPI00140D871F|nr:MULTISPECIES: hypothetical protein [unclassified Neochlamydia]MBS4165895.1 Uncharacterized protein [Neochlamydia sp. AcF65]MBS4170540.1 Uncharacterized protein [Neochlamydia sp. AcF95]
MFSPDTIRDGMDTTHRPALLNNKPLFQTQLNFKILSLTPLIGKFVTKYILKTLDKELREVNVNNNLRRNSLYNIRLYYSKIEQYHDSSLVSNLASLVAIIALVTLVASKIIFIAATCLVAGAVFGVLMAAPLRQIKWIDQSIKQINQEI